jgi:hypothetical protein
MPVNTPPKAQSYHGPARAGRLRGLHRDVPKEELDLFQLATSRMTEPGTGAAAVGQTIAAAGSTDNACDLRLDLSLRQSPCRNDRNEHEFRSHSLSTAAHGARLHLCGHADHSRADTEPPVLHEKQPRQTGRLGSFSDNRVFMPLSDIEIHFRVLQPQFTERERL